MDALVILPFFVLILFIVFKFMDATTEAKYKQKRVEADEQAKANLRRKHAMLVEKYSTSWVTKEILNHICDGDYQKNYPEFIYISKDEISSLLRGQSITFDFTQNRVEHLFAEYEFVGLTANTYWLDKKEAMAEAINRLMGDEYFIEKNGMGSVKETIRLKLKAKEEF